MKLQSVFVSYLLLPILSVLLSIAALILNKQNQLLSNKGLILFSLICSILIAFPGLLSLTGIHFIPLYYILVQVVFLCAGYFYAQQLNNYFADESEVYSKSMMILITLIIVCLGSYLFSLVFNFSGDFRYGLMASTCTYTLIIPLFFSWTYKSLLSIPSEIFKVWKYNSNYQEVVFTSETIEHLIVLELELSKQAQDIDYVKVKAKAPLNFQFGEWFQMFIHDHNVKYTESPIQYKNVAGEADGWIFYTKPSLLRGKQYIDFEQTIEENQLTRDGMTVICKRVHYAS